jgi:hypothetical protein
VLGGFSSGALGMFANYALQASNGSLQYRQLQVADLPVAFGSCAKPSLVAGPIRPFKTLIY